MGDKGDNTPVPPAPDYSGITGELNKNASAYNQLREELYNWAKSEYEKNRGVTDQAVAGDLETQDAFGDFAKGTLDRYADKYRALEDAQIEDAMGYASGERRDRDIGAAQANVGQQFQAARAAAQRELEGYGINPAATRFAALDIGTRSQEAASKAAAGTAAANRVDDMGRVLRAQAIDTGQKGVNAANSLAGTGIKAGEAATNAGLNTTASGAQTMGTPTQYAALSNNSLGLWGNTLNQSYDNQMKQYNAQNAQDNQSSGIGSLIGAGVGLASNFFLPGSGAATGPMASIAGKALFSAKGGAIPDDDEDEDDRSNKPFDDNAYYVIPSIDEAGHRMSPDEAIQRYMHTRNHLGVYPNEEAAYAAHGGPIGEGDGITVPSEASPSGGQAVDDVKAALSAGEMVIPREAVEYYGKRHFYNLIKKAKEEEEAYKQETGAVPSEGPELPGETNFVSRDAALPME